MNIMGRTGRFKLALTALAAALVLLGISPAGASSANISHSYRTDTTIQNGSLVSLDPDRTDYVRLANVDNGNRLAGVAVASDDSLLAVDVTNGKIQIASEGSANVLVSTLNGDIKVGDKIAVSPFNGIGMKALPGSRIIGAAATSFVSSSQGATTREVTDKSGKTSRISVGYISANINIGTNSTGTSNQDINSLQKVVKSITGRVVPTYRVIIALVVVAVALLTLVTLTYGAIYGSIISIGRNPLAKHAIFRTLGSVIAMITVTAVTATITVVLLLS